MADPDNNHPPLLVICMGVSGSGKSTLAAHIAKKYGWVFFEADDFHPAENKAHMASGKPLTDAMREPWIATLCERLSQRHKQGESCVLAYSGLRRNHRQKFRELGYPTLFIHLCGARSVVRQRAAARSNHFMPPELLDSQYSALEPVANEKDIIAIDLTQDVSAITTDAENIIDRFIFTQRKVHTL